MVSDSLRMLVISPYFRVRWAVTGWGTFGCADSFTLLSVATDQHAEHTFGPLRAHPQIKHSEKGVASERLKFTSHSIF